MRNEAHRLNIPLVHAVRHEGNECLILLILAEIVINSIAL